MINELEKALFTINAIEIALVRIVDRPDCYTPAEIQAAQRARLAYMTAYKHTHDVLCKLRNEVMV